MFQFTDAVRSQSKIRLGLFGPSGSGKTTSALRMAYGLCGDWQKIFLIDTERKSASLFSNFNGAGYKIGKFKTGQINAPFTPEKYIEAIQAAQQAGAQVIIIDSASHEWDGRGGILDIHTVETDRARGQSYQAWAKVTPRHNAFVDAMLECNAHLIACFRVKTERVLEETTKKDGKKVMAPKELGLKPVTRDGIDYEMTICFDLDKVTHLATATKDRSGLFHGKPDTVLTATSGQVIRKWLESAETEQTPWPPQTVDENQIDICPFTGEVTPKETLNLSEAEQLALQESALVQEAKARLRLLFMRLKLSSHDFERLTGFHWGPLTYEETILATEILRDFEQSLLAA